MAACHNILCKPSPKFSCTSPMIDEDRLNSCLKVWSKDEKSFKYMISCPKSESYVVALSCTNIWYWRGPKRPKIGPNSSNWQSEMVFAVSLHFHFEPLIIEFRKDWFPPCYQKVQIFSQLALASDKSLHFQGQLITFVAGCQQLVVILLKKESFLDNVKVQVFDKIKNGPGLVN